MSFNCLCQKSFLFFFVQTAIDHPQLNHFRHFPSGCLVLELPARQSSLSGKTTALAILCANGCVLKVEMIQQHFFVKHLENGWANANQSNSGEK